MEDIFGIVVFMIFVGVSLFGRAAKQAKEQQQQRQRQAQAPRPQPQQQPAPMKREVRRSFREEQQERQARQERVTPPLAPTAARLPVVDGDDEGISMMLQGERPSVEARGRARRKDQIEQLRSRRTQSRGSVIGQALQSRQTAAQAIVLAEVLGKPLALRDRRRK